MTAIRSYRDLEVWQRAMDLVTSIYGLSQHFPKEEIYGLTSQLRRAAVSVPSNIAEGQSKRSTKDYVRFLQIAYGSIAEMETQLMIARNLNYLNTEAAESTLTECATIGRMLNGLINSLQLSEARSPNSETHPYEPRILKSASHA